MGTKVAILTAGGFAPCLSSAVAGLIERYSAVSPDSDIIAYRYGYEGLLKGDQLAITADIRQQVGLLHRFGGSPLGNSRVKLTNRDDLVKRGLIGPDEDPLKKAADQLVADGVQVLHTIGGDDTNTTAADLARYLQEHDYGLTVVGLPKTIDNDIVPIRQSLGADTAAEMAARFAQNVLGEHNSSPRELIIHEIMGRHCGWLAAAAAYKYRGWLDQAEWLPAIGLTKQAWDIHAIFIPEATLDIEAEAARLKAVMDSVGNVNIFLSEGAGVATILEEMQNQGEVIPRDAFGHVRLDGINPGAWFARRFAGMIGADKVMVQKSGYFSRSAAPNDYDLALIRSMTDLAVDCALGGVSGVIGQDEADHDALKAIEFSRIAGAKPFDLTQPWYHQLLTNIGQPLPEAVATEH